jgi:DNA-binding HxlR family transcriptional regulator
MKVVGFKLKVKGCPILFTAEAIGDTWTIMILRELFAGNDRFDGLMDRVGASSNILSNRLKRLIEHGIVCKTPYQEKPTRYKYQLTEAGLSLFPIVLSVVKWGNAWSPHGATVSIYHKPCGEITPEGLSCPLCGEALEPENTRFGIAKLVALQQTEGTNAGSDQG